MIKLHDKQNPEFQDCIVFTKEALFTKEVWTMTPGTHIGLIWFNGH